jgi:hypothetical protein
LADKEVTVKLGLDSRDYESKIAKAAQATKGIQANWAQAASGVRDLAGMVGVAVEKVGEFVKYAGKIDSVSSAFNSLAASAGKSGQSIIEGMTKATRGTVDTMKEMEAANLAINLMGSQVVTKLPMLAEIAMAAARSSGKEVSEMLNDVIVASGRQSVMILDNLGISSSVAAKYQEEYARKLGKTREQLDETQKSAAFFYAVEKAGGELVQKMNLDTLTLGENLQKLGATSKNVADDFTTKLNPALNNLAQDANRSSGIFREMGTVLGDEVGKRLARLRVNVYEASASFFEMQKNWDQWKMGMAIYWKMDEETQEKLKYNFALSSVKLEYMNKKVNEASDSYNNYGQVATIANKNIATAAAAAAIAGPKKDDALFDEYVKKKEMLGEYSNYKLSVDDFLLQKEQDWNNQSIAYYGQVIDAKMGLDRQYWQNVAGVTSTASVFMAESNKGLFRFGQGLAVGEAIINSHLAATKALAQLGTFGGPVAAAIIYAAGILRVKQIAAQKPPEPPKQNTPKFEEGVIGIQHDTFAQIHKGETVVPKTFTDAIKAGEMALSGPGTSSARVIQLVVDGKVLSEITDDHREKTARRMGRSNYGGTGVYN